MMKGIYPVANRLTMDAVITGGRAYGSPESITKMSEVASAVLVIATFMPAAKQRVAVTGEIDGKAKQRARPKAAPAVKKGKI